MDSFLKVLFIDAQTGFYKIKRYKVGEFFGPVDLGLHLAGRYNSMNIGTGLLAGSIFPGSNRLIFSGFSPCWGGFYISSMGGAGLVFDNLGINMISIVGKSAVPSMIYLNRTHGEEIEIELRPIELNNVWQQGETGVYGLMHHMLNEFGSKYENDPRILVTGPASLSTDFGGIASAPIKKGEITPVDTWAGRGGFGSKLIKEHGIAGIIYGGTYIDQDFTDRKVADSWFENKYQKKLAAKDIEATTKYRFDPNFQTGGTFGVNFATIGGNIIAFNYRSIYWSEEERLKLHKDFVVDHYLKQFNEETIQTKQQKNCGEPCAAVCKKLNNEFKKDYEPYQTMGPLCGIFDQRAAEKLNRKADALGFDAISVGGVLAWLMDCVNEGLLTTEELGISEKPKFTTENFDLIKDSMHNALIGIQLLENIIAKKGILDFSEGVRKWARRLSREKGVNLLNNFVFNSYARNGWMVPNQYWTTGVLSPMAIMGKYYMNYGKEFISPRKLGQTNADRMRKELVLDNLGICRFHRAWAEEMTPDIIEQLYGMGQKYLQSIENTASRINGRNSSIFWESERNIDFIYTFLKRKQTIDKSEDPDLLHWINRFEQDKKAAALDFWYEIHKGAHESLLEFN